LISLLRHREFGILVTTSCLGNQAYQELRHDRQLVVVVAGGYRRDPREGGDGGRRKR
jgi:hypothetical protein